MVFVGSGKFKKVSAINVWLKKTDEVITHYFHRGYPYDVIVGFLQKRERLQMCVRTLKRRLGYFGLKRKVMLR